MAFHWKLQPEMTTLDALQLGEASLPKRRGIPDPRREARWLLARAWGVDEVRLRTHLEHEVPPEVEARYRKWLERRAAGEPAEHLTGLCEFWGRQFGVSPAVLVPRPETELLVEVALELPVSPTARVLDVGTGSGCIAVTLAAERPRWTVAAVDVSKEALEIARSNAVRHGVDVSFHAGDLTAGFEPPRDLVVANLPYIPTGDLAGLPREVGRDPASALDGGPDGLDLIRRLVADLPRLLRVCGAAVLELGEDQADAVAEMASAEGLGVARRITDPGGCERVIVLQPR
jgi:release factor glutamine methyltransferase